MLTHPMTFLIGYLVVTFILSSMAVGPLVVFATMLFRRKSEHLYTKGVWLGASITAWAFMILHYLLYLRGYRISSFSRLFRDVFYPPQYF